MSIIAVRNKKDVAGYVYFRPKPGMKAPSRKKLLAGYSEKRFQKKTEPEYYADFLSHLKALKKRGLKLKFVPNKKSGYLFERGQFKKKTE